MSLTARILAVNIFALAILAGSLFYLDSFRSRLTAARLQQAQTEARIIADALGAAAPEARRPLLYKLGRDSGARIED